ncbi:MAG: thioesterase family protein [Epulopiscium sp.]|jgi:fluoroacetyl-CoA thioesterase|nr:thioesterase family protein [Candidatus Epulonipiscium sp.]
MEFNLTPGMMLEEEYIVTEADTAIHFGSGQVTVLATPKMIAWMEGASLNAVLPSLPKGYDTVGTSIQVSHLAATPVGMKVRVVAELIEVKGKLLTFKVKAYDEIDKIGEGIHGRAIVELDKFLRRTNEKGNK